MRQDQGFWCIKYRQKNRTEESYGIGKVGKVKAAARKGQERKMKWEKKSVNIPD